MGNKEITNSESLLMQISLLKAERTENELVLSQTFNELTQLIFNPILTVKEQRFDLQGTKRDLINLSKTVLNMGTDYIIEQSLGRRQGIKSLLTSIMVEIVSIPLISRNITKLFAGIDRKIFG
jgi:hypothetical protein